MWRLYDHRDTALLDLIGLPNEDPLAEETIVVHHPTRSDVHTTYRRDEISRVEALHETITARGAIDDEPIEVLRRRCRGDIERLDVGVRRLVNPHRYHVSLTERLHRLRADLIASTRPDRGDA